MRIPVSERRYLRCEDGSITREIKGRSPFIFITDELWHEMKGTQTVTLLDERFRFIDTVNGPQLGAEWYVAMKDSVIARSLCSYYQIAHKFVQWFAPKEAVIWKFKSGETIPWWTISGLLVRTFISR